MIAHCMKKSSWEKLKDEAYWGQQNIDNGGFVHCSQIKYLWRVLPNFEREKEELVIICMDEEKIESEIKYEDDGNYGRTYPHVYGLINNNAVTMVLDYLKDENGHYKKNPELSDFIDE